MSELTTKEFETLSNLADRLDEGGNKDEAIAITAALKKIVAEKEDDAQAKNGRSMSGKAKAKFRALYKAAKSLCDADVDCRGEYKSACRKAETCAEDICDLLKDCDFIEK